MQRINLFLLFVLSCFSLSANAEIINFGIVNADVFRGGRLAGGEKDFLALQELGVDTIINLDFMHSDDENLCQQFSMSCHRYPILLFPWHERNFNYGLLQKAFAKVVQALKKQQKVYIHCLHGSDRTGALAAALTIREQICLKGNGNRQQLKKDIKTQLKKYNFHQLAFPRLFSKIMQWVDDTPSWICQK